MQYFSGITSALSEIVHALTVILGLVAFALVSLFNGISIFVGYLMLKPSF